MASRDELAAFLRARREALQPAEVGLPSGRRRRTPGLRREEVALLAGVSLTWYTWLEQGRRINASRDVLGALARGLRLDEAARRHLFDLAGPADADDVAGEPEQVPDALSRLIEAMEPAPAYVLGSAWQILAWNRAEALLYPALETLPEPQRNLLWIIFADPTTRDLLADWETQARRILAEFRAGTARVVHRPDVATLIGELSLASASFAEWWAERDVAQFQTRLRRYHHPRAGELVFEYQQLTSSEWPSLRVVCQLAVPGDDSVQRLAAWRTIA